MPPRPRPCRPIRPANLPPLRQTEAENGAALHRLIVERDALDAEEARAREAAQRLRQRIDQAGHDRQRESTLDADALAALETLAQEGRTLEDISARAVEDLNAAQEQSTARNDQLVDAESRLESLTADLAEWNAKKQSQERAKSVASALADTSAEQLGVAERRLEEAMAGAAEAPDVRSAEDAAETAQAAARAARDILGEMQAAFETAQAAENELRPPLEAAERQAQILSAETRALADLLRPQGADLWPPLVDSVKVAPGYEAALAAALGDDLEAPLDEAAPHYWRDLGDVELPSLPEGVERLGLHVDAPHALARRLAMTGVVAEDAGKALQAELKPGQRLVTLRGGLWRWDGYSASADAPSPAAVRLAQRNRLDALEIELVAAKDVRAQQFECYSQAKAAVDAARDALRSAEQDARRAEQALMAAQEHTAKTARAAAERMSRLASLESEIRRLGQSRDAALEFVLHAEEAQRELGDGVAITESVAAARGETSEARAQAAEARVALDNLRREAVRRTERLRAIAEETNRWQARRDAAARQIAELDRRLEEMRAELVQLDEVPAVIAQKREALLEAIAGAEARRNEAADARATAEQRLAEADKHAKAANAALSTAREERARAQALAENAAARLTELHTRIRDELDAAPEELPERAEIKEGEELPAQGHAEKRVEKLKEQS